MSTSVSQVKVHRKRWWLAGALSIAAILFLVAGRGWISNLKNTLQSAGATPHENEAEAAGEHDHEGEAAGEHDHEGEAADAHDKEAEPKYDHVHDDGSSLKLSKQAEANIGLQLTRVELKSFERTIDLPGMVVERPGWSTVEITAPMTGIITRIRIIQGEAVKAGQPLFEIRLTHEDLLQLQAEFLRSVEELDVIEQEVNRLEKAASDGAIAGKTLLERKYEQQKQQAALRSQRQSLLLHGLSSGDVDRIVSQRTLVQNVMISAPTSEKFATPDAKDYRMQVQQLKVTVGKHVSAGDILCVLASHGDLYIEGKAFEQDAEAINRATADGWQVAASMESQDKDGGTINGLKILYTDDRIDAESRAFRFYVTLPNRLLRRDQTPDGRRFIYWQYKPGQRMLIKIPVQRWADRIVLPIEAVVQEGPDYFVFQAYGDHFDRRGVHVEYRDRQWAVIANDGAIKPGDQVAASAAHQMQMALKNKSGGAPGPHAGHNH
jgi:membrane fusion protein, heavy metal efflux system